MCMGLVCGRTAEAVWGTPSSQSVLGLYSSIREDSSELQPGW